MLEHMSRNEFAQCRRIIIQSILATDMKSHTELSRKLATFADDTFENFGKDTEGEVFSLFFAIVLHTGDLSGQALPLRQALLWGERVINEFSIQAKKEEALELPVAPFMMNTHDPVKAAGVQKGYIDFILKPWWVQFVRFFSPDEDFISGLDHVNAVREFYVKKSEEGSLEDKKKKKKKAEVRVGMVKKNET